VLAAVGGALTAAYFLRLLRRVTHGPSALSLPSPLIARTEWAAWSPLVLLALLIGLVPALVTGATTDPIAALTEALR
jgi:NADH-quinone oxidoreductase subunit M